jgi:N-acetylmuramoyl-L-alanine amidase
MSEKKTKLIIAALLSLLLLAGGCILLLRQDLQEAQQTQEITDQQLTTQTPSTPPTKHPAPTPADTPSKNNKQNPIVLAPILPGEHDTTLSDLGTRPDWQTLDLWQETITHDDFLRLLTTVYTVDDSWKRYITVKPDHAIILTDSHKPGATYRLDFAPNFNDSTPDRSWQSVDDLPPATRKKPLTGLRIAIDPGHIGGEFAKMEERWFKIGDNKPVIEGELTLTTAKIIKRQLRALGAKTYLVRGSNEPVNPNRPEFYRDLAIAKAKSLGKTDEATIQRFQKKFFYLTGEIRARARRINLAFRPDLVLCLHYNAESWADPNNPTLTANNHYHILLHGALTASELAHDDERFEMLTKILQHNHDEEQGLGIALSQSFAKITGLPAYEYEPHSSRARKISGADGLWARNLLANRIYHCPVIFLEPYVMNNREVHDRVQLGNYKGTRTVNGVTRQSLQQEYANAVTEGLKNYYLSRRIIYDN